MVSRLIRWFTSGGALFVMLLSPVDAGTPEGCSLETVKGAYLFQYSGYTVTDGQRIPFAYGGREVYDGAGNLTGVHSGSDDGQSFQMSSYTGTYTVNLDCTGTITTAENFDIFVDETSGEVVFVQTDAGVMTSGFLRRQSVQGEVSFELNNPDQTQGVQGVPGTQDECSLETVQGAYVYRSRGYLVTDGQRIPFAYGGRDVYDGAGNLTGVSSGSVGGESYQMVPYAGTYTVNSDCTGTLTTTSSASVSNYDIFVDAKSGEVVFVQTDAGVVTSGLLRKRSVRGKISFEFNRLGQDLE